MLDLEAITRQVKRNCDISDARHAGLFSICGLALRLRDLFKWHQGMEPWEERDPGEVLEWIGSREALWEQLADAEYTEITISNRSFDPFDHVAINALLEPEGLFYGAGYASSLKPSFFLTRIREKRRVNGHPVYRLRRELARDMHTIVAQTQDDRIVLREASTRMFVWDQMQYLKKSGRPALKFALGHCGVQDLRPSELRSHLTTILGAQMDTFIYHEIGEMADTVFERGVWREIIAAYPHTPVEFLARAVKDLLADTSKVGTLQHIIRRRRPAALGFYVAFQDGLLRALFPELRESFPDFVRTADWKVIERAVSIGYDTARRHAGMIVDLHVTGKRKKDPRWAENRIKERMVDPLNARRTAA